MKQLAKAQTIRSNQLTAEIGTEALSGAQTSTLWISNMGQKVGVEVKATDTLKELASRINNTIKTLSTPLNLTASVVDNRLIFKSDNTGLPENTSTEGVKYSAGRNTVLKTLSVSTDLLKDGDIVITDTSETSTTKGKKWTSGKDFDIVQGANGNEIRWRTNEANTIPTTYSYTAKYKAGNGDKYKQSTTITRGSGSVDVLDFTPVTNGKGTTKITIKDSDGFTYNSGDDFRVSGTSIQWLKAAPDAGKTYTVEYEYTAVADDNAVFDIAMTRGNADTLTWKNDVSYDDLSGQTLVIKTASGKTCYEGADFTVAKDGDGKAVVNWTANSAWIMPDPDETYTLQALASDGTTTALATGTRTKGDTVDFEAAGFTTHTGTITDVTYTQTKEDGEEETFSLLYKTVGGSEALENPYLAVEPDGKTLNWKVRPAGDPITPPANSADLTVSYTYADTEFSLDDDGSGLLSALGLDLTDEEHYTAAQDAVVLIDGNEVEISANYIDYDNDILKGVRLDFKGVGIVSVDVTQDTDKTVESINTFVESYNTLMDWINVRSSEKQVNTDYSEDSTTLSRNSDDFHTSWGLLYGNSYLRNTKAALRSVISQNYDFTFKSRTSSEPVYGDMGYNGIKRTTLANGTEVDGSTTLRIKVGDHTANITITSSDTLESIRDKINSEDPDPDTNEAWSLHYNDEDKNLSAEELAKKRQNYVKAEIVDGKLVIKQGSTAGSNEVSLSGTTALNALKMNTTYKGLYQIGIETTSDNYGISGELEFNSQKFLDAMEENPEETEQLMLAFARKMDTQVKSMLQSSGGYSGTLKTEITNLETQITSIDEYLKKFQDRLDRMEENLRSQYAAAEDRIAKLSQQASSISGILTQLSGGGNANAS